MSEIEKIARDRYRLRAHDHIITLSAQDLLDAMDYGLLHAKLLRVEALSPQEPGDDIAQRLQALDSLELEIDEYEEKLCSAADEMEAIFHFRSLKSAQAAQGRLMHWFEEQGYQVLIDAEKSFRHSATVERKQS